MNKLHSKEYQKSYQLLYGVIGVLGILLPILDVWKCGWVIPPSISESYYLGAIVPFVLILGSLGIIFFCNHGFDERDKWCNRISGLAALGVICFPCDSPKYIWHMPFPAVHITSAIVFFTTCTYMCWFAFTNLRSAKGWTRTKDFRNIIYRFCGFAIIIGMVLTATGVVSLYYGEVLMLESFGLAYLIQGKVILKDR
jgi:hypothetical protein